MATRPPLAGSAVDFTLPAWALEARAQLGRVERRGRIPPCQPTQSTLAQSSVRTVEAPLAPALRRSVHVALPSMSLPGAPDASGPRKTHVSRASQSFGDYSMGPGGAGHQRGGCVAAADMRPSTDTHADREAPSRTRPMRRRRSSSSLRAPTRTRRSSGCGAAARSSRITSRRSRSRSSRSCRPSDAFSSSSPSSRTRCGARRRQRGCELIGAGYSRSGPTSFTTSNAIGTSRGASPISSC